MYLGIDTSNYTTSMALYNQDNNEMISKTMLLKVKSGERGLRQSDAVYQHNLQLPKVAGELFCDTGITDIEAVGVSDSPRHQACSFMPCFMAGLCCAETIASISNIPCYKFSHQQGHVAAALYSTDKLYLIKEEFIALHISGGTTEVLFVSPDEDSIINTRIISKSLDLNAGQAIDRVGVMLGMNFPAGKKIDELAQKSNKNFKISPYFNGMDFSISGVENKCRAMLENGDAHEDIAKYCIDYITFVIKKLTDKISKQYAGLPVVFSGGVMSNSIIRGELGNEFNSCFASTEFSSDNAAGIAVLAGIKDRSL
jgi:N6-L-threonylcarbamoyladenine synthase